jgi:hypothetical protein
VTAAQAAEHWARLAGEEREQAVWDAAHGYGDVSCYHARAETYDRCAESLRLESTTGLTHCMCHLRPHRDCPSGGSGLRL